MLRELFHRHAGEIEQIGEASDYRTVDGVKVLYDTGAGKIVAPELYVACGIATALGSIFVALAMNHMEIALAVLVASMVATREF